MMDPWEVVNTSPASVDDGWIVVGQTPTAQPSMLQKAGQFGVGAAENVLSNLTGMAATPASGFAGVAQSAYNAAAPYLGAKPGMSAADRVAQVQQLGTYKPRTEMGQYEQQLINKPFEMWGKFADTAGETVSKTTGSPALGAAANTAIQLAPAALLHRAAPVINAGTTMLEQGARSLPGKVATALERPPVAEIVQNARKANYVLVPSQAGRNIGRYAEGVTNSAKLSAEAAVKNQKNTNRLAAIDLGLPENTKITPKVLDDLREPLNGAYKEVSQIGEIITDEKYKNSLQKIGRTPGKSFSKVNNPDIELLRDQYSEPNFHSADAVLQIKTLRNASRKNIKNIDPAKNELGYAQRQVANIIEEQIERHVQRMPGSENLVQQFRDARQKLAVIHSVEDALNTARGDISANKLAKMKKAGVPLNNNLKTIAEIHDAFPGEMREAAKIKNKAPITVLEGLAGVGGVVASSNPALAGLGLLGVATRPLTRKFLLSDAYQNRLASTPKGGKAFSPPQTLESVQK